MEFKVGDKVKFVGNLNNHNSNMYDLSRDIKKYRNNFTISYAGNFYEFKENPYWCITQDEIELIKQEKFTKSDLKDGDIVTYRNENQRTLKGDILIDQEGFRVGTLKSYDDNLKHINVTENDIIKVERPVKYETVFERKEEILDEVEKEYLRGVIRPFRDEVSHIRKNSTRKEKEYLSFNFKDGDYTNFKNFETDSMYKGMKLGKEYTLEELRTIKG